MWAALLLHLLRVVGLLAVVLLQPEGWHSVVRSVSQVVLLLLVVRPEGRRDVAPTVPLPFLPPLVLLLVWRYSSGGLPRPCSSSSWVLATAAGLGR